MKTYNELSEKQEALIAFLDLTPDEWKEIEQSVYDDCIFTFGNKEYLVCDDEEADERFSEAVQNYIDDCILSSIPENLQQFFDYDKYENACSIEGRGAWLSNYNGSEEEENGYYIYRLN